MAALYVKVPRDLSQVKSKFLFNLTKRQLLCFLLAAVIGFPVFFLLKKLGNPTLATLGMMVIMLPMFLFAMYERNGQPMEVILKQYIQANFVRPKVRVYKTNNDYMAILEIVEVQKEVERIVEASKESARNKGTGEKNTGKADKSIKKADRRDSKSSKKKE